MQPTGSDWSAWLFLGFAGIALEARAADVERPGDLGWRFVALERGVDSERVDVVVADPQGARWAVGGPDGVTFYVPGEKAGFSRLTRVGPVGDLAFDPEGALWIASPRWLWSWREGEGLEHHSVETGEQANRIRRVVALGEWVIVGTDAGVFAGGHGRPFTRLDGALPRARVDALAVRERVDDAATLEVWAALRGRLWQVVIPRDPGAKRPASKTERLPPVPGLPVAQGPVQVSFDAIGFDVVLVYPRALAVRRGPAQPFEIARPAPALGASLRWLTRGADRFWLATEGGLLWADRVGGPWRRANSPAGDHSIARVAARQGRVMLASAVGLLEGSADRSSPPPRLIAGGDPDIRSVQRETLRYLGLGRERFRRLRRGVDSRGWWPTLRLGAGVLFGRNWRRDDDQHFSYGELHSLRDREARTQRDVEVSVELDWDLGEAIFDPLAIDLSREMRQRIALRDDVLDQVNQLYFERQAALASLRTLDPGSAEAVALERRAVELAAGLDGWTGGWFRRSLGQAEPP